MKISIAIKLTYIAVFILFQNDSFSQENDRVHKEDLGISFDIPTGWQGREAPVGYVLGSNTTPGMILITTNEVKSMEEMKNEAKFGIQEANLSLTITTEIEKIDEHSLGAGYSGFGEGQPIKAYMIGMVNDLGYGLTIIAMTTSEMYSATHKEACLSICKSTKFVEPVLPDEVKQWKEALNGARLTYMDSYSSYDYSGDYTTGGGYSSEEVIDLCPQGYFSFSSSSSMSVDEGAAYASSHDSDDGNGNWDVVSNANGQSVLKLTFHNGKIREYILTYEDEKTLLNGYRYFRTYGESTDDGPNCD